MVDVNHHISRSLLYLEDGLGVFYRLASRGICK